MTDAAKTEVMPMVTGSNGEIRVGSTRVTLDSVIAAYHDGATPEEISQQYPTVSLADVYQVIGYYLRHTEEVEAYLAVRRRKAEQVKRENEARWPANSIRKRLQARIRT